MFKKYDVYDEETKYAQVNRDADTRKWSIGYIVIKLFIIMSFFGTGYYMWSLLVEKKHTVTYKTKVMSATHTIDDNEELMFALESIDVGSVDTTNFEEEHKSIEDALSEIIDDDSLPKKENYLDEKRLEEKISVELKSIN